MTLVARPLYFSDPPRTASTRRRANRRVTLVPKPYRSTLETARIYIDGIPAARGFVDEGGVQWVAFYDVDDDGRVIPMGWKS